MWSSWPCVATAVTFLSTRSAISSARLMNPIPVSTTRSRSRPRTCQMLQRISGITCGSHSRVIESSIVLALEPAVGDRAARSSGLLLRRLRRLLGLGLLGPAGSDARRLARHLRIDGRPRRIEQSGGLVARGPSPGTARAIAARRPSSPTHRRARRPTPAPWRWSCRGVAASASISHGNGNDTGAWSRARTDHGANTVLCGAFWLKSMKMRSPRSSFHHDAVMRSGCRRSSSRATATAALRTATLSWVGLQAHVDVQAAVAGGLDVAGHAELVEQLLGGRGSLLGHRVRRCPDPDRGRCAARRSARGRQRAPATNGTRGSRG